MADDRRAERVLLNTSAFVGTDVDG